MTTIDKDRVQHRFIVRETPWWFAIKEVVADLRGVLYIKTVDVGTRTDMEASYLELYGEKWQDPPPIDIPGEPMTRRSRVPAGRMRRDGD